MSWEDAMLFLCVLAALANICVGCQNIQLYHGTLSSSLEIESVTLPPSATSCNCCGLCHQNTACGSLTFQPEDGRCTLYSAVGGPAVFNRVRGGGKQFFFMPGRSQSGEFCRSDSDCVTAGDLCRGRMCTTDDTVTCRDFYLLNGALRSDRYWGFLAGREILLQCFMGNRGGFTKLVHATPSAQWNATSRLNYTIYGNDGTAKTSSRYSILW